MKIKFTKNPKKKKLTKKEKKDKKQKKLVKNPIVNTFQCPYCEQIITIEHNIKGNYTITCPNCQHKGVIINQEQKENENVEEKLPNPPWFHQPFLRSKILGLFLIITGCAILLIDNSINTLKLSITLIFIGGLIFTMISEKKFIILQKYKPKKSKSTMQNIINANQIFLQRNKLVVSEKITLLIITATLLLFLVTNPAELEIFLVLLYLSLLIIKELIDEFTPVHVKTRLNYIIIIFFIVFITIIAERIITILDI